MSRDTFRTLSALRRTARSIALTHRLPAEQRARLVLTLSEVSAVPLGHGRQVTLTTAHESAGDGPGRLTIALGFPQQGVGTTPDPDRLPLPGRATADGTIVWHLPLPPDLEHPDRTGRIVLPSPSPPPSGRTAQALVTASPDNGPADLALMEEELGAALARADALSEAYRRLENELAETNSGFLALYVQLEERDEHLRKAHGRTLRALEDALRPRPLKVEGAELAVHYAPAGDDDPTGGDLYDWFALPDGTVHITVVDALGHGVTSTRTALTVTHAVRTLALEGHPLETIVARTHEILTPFDENVMATLLLARLDPATGELKLANGSHPPALLVRPDGTGAYLEVRGRGIGYPQPGSERVLTATLEAGDLVVLYTDGLTENRRDPRLGEELLLKSALRHRGEPTADIPGAIAEDILTHVLHPDDTLAIAIRLGSRNATDS